MKKTAAVPKKAPDSSPIPPEATPDPADIIYWLLQEKRKGGSLPHP